MNLYTIRITIINIKDGWKKSTQLKIIENMFKAIILNLWWLFDGF